MLIHSWQITKQWSTDSVKVLMDLCLGFLKTSFNNGRSVDIEHILCLAHFISLYMEGYSMI